MKEPMIYSHIQYGRMISSTMSSTDLASSPVLINERLSKLMADQVFPFRPTLSADNRNAREVKRRKKKDSIKPEGNIKYFL